MNFQDALLMMYKISGMYETHGFHSGMIYPFNWWFRAVWKQQNLWGFDNDDPDLSIWSSTFLFRKKTF